MMTLGLLDLHVKSSKLKETLSVIFVQSQDQHYIVLVSCSTYLDVSNIPVLMLPYDHAIMVVLVSTDR